MGTGHVQISLILAALLLLAGGASVAAAPNYQVTPTATPTATVPIGCWFGPCESTPTPATTATAWAILTPTPPNFGGDDDYISPPTGIPDISFPDPVTLPAPPPTPEWTPQPLATVTLPPVEVLYTPVPTMVPILNELTLTYPTPAPISGAVRNANITATGIFSDISGALLGTENTISGVLSYTNYLSSTIYSATLATDSFNVYTAPAWYAPKLPRPIANVGWQFEKMGQDVRHRYSLAAWGLWITSILALPIQFIKGLAPFGQLMGPFGLFLAWLLIMFPVVLLFRFLAYLKNLAIQLFNFLFDIVKFVISFIPGVG